MNLQLEVKEEGNGGGGGEEGRSSFQGKDSD